MNGQRASGFVWFLIAIGTAVASDSGKTPFAPVPMSQRHTLAKRLLSYTQAFGEKDWKSLYDLVSDGNKIDFYGTLKVDRATFVRDMERTADSGRLINFVPVRTDETGEVGTFDIYGCGKIPQGTKTLERIVAVRAVRKHDKWFFTNWDYPLPEESCSHLSNPEWKPRIVLELRDPMHQVFCELNECTDKMRQTFNREVEQSPKQP